MNQRGTALVITALFTAVFAILIVTVYVLMKSTMEGAFYARKQAQAAGLAEAGLEAGILAVRTSAFCASTEPWTRNLDNGEFTVTLAPALPISVASAVVQNPPVPIDITAVGTVSGFFPWRSAHRTLTLRVEPALSTLAHGVFAVSGDVATATGTVVDAYDSRVDPDPLLFLASAPVTANGAITFTQDAAVIGGDAFYFLGPAPTAAQVTHLRDQLLAKATFQLLVSTAEMVCDTNASGVTPSGAYDPGTGALTVTGGVTLAPGEYRFTSLTVLPGGTLTLPGPGRTDLHVDGPVSVQGPVVNAGRKPADLVLWGARGSNPAVSLDYAGDFVGVLLVSSSAVTLGPALRYFGTITAGSLELGEGTQLHFDLALSTRTSSREGLYLGAAAPAPDSWRSRN